MKLAPEPEKWSPQQEDAITVVEAWLKDKSPSAPQVLRMFGFAGTGKTTLAKRLAKAVKGTVLYAAFTGKAALQLRMKGCFGASTIHSLVYTPVVDEKTGDVKFVWNADGEASNAMLIIIDEVSMVNEELARGLLKFGKKILVLGDPAQLPPVKGEGFFINAKPDIMLTEVHRQALDNPIIRMSMDIREGRRLRTGQYGASLVVNRHDITKDELRPMVLGSDQLICGINRSRTAFNQRIRDLKGLRGTGGLHWPAVGDRLVCLKNNKEKNIFNGGLWNVEEMKAKQVSGRVVFTPLLKSLDEPERTPIEARIFEEFFLGTDKDLDWRERKNSLEFTFGWALTCHKSQGSQWNDVIVFDESRVFRDDADKWLYTACTRAVERVTIVQ